ncbi:MAG: DNA-3-methyladenine glycosylase [Vicinamibacterales bacterium]|nr:DNA-3-methyladenine glycosylase [Vicinamibacterales bacterium]MDP7478851.1 DNA-3-methyladenine glycosylase [Vicinamibacterales bacterium]MDP7692183.1 DNA-3-methyladenine glycosylase [Vicinamibacterales bacterium]HJN46605.1 DNA-3-methyladenine glycosylase [Vicinamibacterales bacterium]
MPRPLQTRRRPPRAFFRRDPVCVARELLGNRLVSTVGGKRTAGIIVETEAYLGTRDKAAHTYGGRRTRRNRTMWGAPGHAYVYFVYGMHHCVNVVAGETGDPVAVLIRALEPDTGIDTMFERRHRATRATDLCSGPAKLCLALGIDLGLDGEDLTSSDYLRVESSNGPSPLAATIVTTPRVGIAYAEEWQNEPLRFFVADNPHVSSARR